jgi:hypothetical protein
MAHIFVVQLEIPAEHEAEFNRIYDTEHFPTLSKVAGVRSAARYRLEHSTVPGMQRYLTVYELDARCAEERGLGRGRGLRRLGDQDPPALDEPPSQRLRPHRLRNET